MKRAVSYTHLDVYKRQDEEWALATKALEETAKGMNKPYVFNEGDGAFYGPKLDFHLKDSIGRARQCGTIQLDFQFQVL